MALFKTFVTLTFLGTLGLSACSSRDESSASQSSGAPDAASSTSSDATGTPEAAVTKSSSAEPAADGKLEIIAPAEIGVDYWLYVDGHIISSPPHSKQTVTATLPAGSHVVEMAILANPTTSAWFPLRFTDTSHPEIEGGSLTELRLANPEDVSMPLPQSHIAFCDALGTPGPIPITEQNKFQEVVAAYHHDPIVNGLRDASASNKLEPSSIVKIELPAEDGGSHEFTGTQVEAIVSALQDHYYFPSADTIEQCGLKTPFSSEYAGLNRMLAPVRDELHAFHLLATSLNSYGTEQEYTNVPPTDAP